MPHLAMNSTHVDQRQMLQQSQFTLHDSREPLQEHAQADSFVRSYVVPKSAKGNLRIELRSIGLNRHSLFPDLSNIALSIIDDVRNPVRTEVDDYAAEKRDEWAASDAARAITRKRIDDSQHDVPIYEDTDDSS